MSSTRRLALSAALIIGATMLLAGCVESGDQYAAGLAERVVIGIGDDITPPYPEPREADFLAARAIQNPRLPRDVVGAEFVVEAMAWEGNSGDDEGARIELRITVHVPAATSNSWGPSQPEGDAVRCWELTVFGLHDYDSLKLSEIGCTDDPAPAPPTPEPLPTLPPDVQERLTAAVQDATAADIDDRVREAFAEDYYTIESEAKDGELVVTLGIPSELLCALGVQHVDGRVEVWPYVEIIRGESSCSPDLYFHPVTTH